MTEDSRLVEAHGALDRIRAGANGDEVESETLDCKLDPSTRDNRGTTVPGAVRDDAAARLLAESAACLANHDGGALLVGIDDKRGGATAFIGTALEAAWLRERIRQLTLPPLTVTVDVLDEPEARLLLVRVGRNGGTEPYAAAVSKNGGRRKPRRVGTSCHDMETLAEQMTWLQTRTNYDWSAMPSGRPISDARPAAIASLRDLLLDSGEEQRRRLADLDDTGLLRRLQLLRDDGSLTNAGALLTCAGSDPRIIYLGRHAASAAAAHRVELSGRGLAEELQRILDTLAAQTAAFRLPFSQAVLGVVGAVPAPAAREALVNAIMHRDWDRPEPIVVEQTEDRLVVSSPGDLYGGVTLDTLLTSRSQTRNRLLGDALRSLRLAEGEGTGVDRMYIEMVRLGHPPPAFEERDGGVRVALVGGEPNAAVLAVHNDLPPTLRDDARAAVAIDLLRSAVSITRDDLARHVREADDELQAFLARAEAEGLLRQAAEPRPGGMPAWRLANDVRAALGSVLPYYSRPIGESVALVAQLAAQHGSVRNRDVQDLLGVNQPRASQILRRAVQDGELRLADGAKATGRGTAYVPAASHPTP